MNYKTRSLLLWSCHDSLLGSNQSKVFLELSASILSMWHPIGIVSSSVTALLRGDIWKNLFPISLEIMKWNELITAQKLARKLYKESKRSRTKVLDSRFGRFNVLSFWISLVRFKVSVLKLKVSVLHFWIEQYPFGNCWIKSYTGHLTFCSSTWHLVLLDFARHCSGSSGLVRLCSTSPDIVRL